MKKGKKTLLVDKLRIKDMKGWYLIQTWDIDGNNTFVKTAPLRKGTPGVEELNEILKHGEGADRLLVLTWLNNSIRTHTLKFDSRERVKTWK